ncbi:hypothetical protein BU23DRAFT_136819 [Bimuria novae-zelandiae CBS 107.79]|uniref:Uncharacterized protein n=1 Tax=Bimuria novae-zelandiae CBS 107.79 TaxID=1447943 RepID=A0A6A5VAN0_9PLEO|nr:hypothetical protein BU23DRAFT_136819 [Bimuria novae-zelandiae CBS 107.79]
MAPSSLLFSGSWSTPNNLSHRNNNPRPCLSARRSTPRAFKSRPLLASLGFALSASSKPVCRSAGLWLRHLHAFHPQSYPAAELHTLQHHL